METQNFTTTILVDQSPSVVFSAVNNPKTWWSDDITGVPDEVNGQWRYRFGDNHRSTIRTIELIPGKKVVWLIEDNYFKSIQDQREWVGNTIVFEISKKGDKTELVFTQVGLTPAYECYKACHYAWTGFIQKSLKSLITTGKAQPKWYEQQ
jgi:hypothetical protein